MSARTGRTEPHLGSVFPISVSYRDLQAFPKTSQLVTRCPPLSAVSPLPGAY